MKRAGYSNLVCLFLATREVWRWGGGERGLSEPVDIEFALSRLLIFFSSLYIVKFVAKEHQLKICHSGSRPACQILSLLHGQASLFHVIILVLGSIQQFQYNVRWLGVWKRKRATFISRRGFGRSVRAGCVLELSRAGIFHGCHKHHLCGCLEFGLHYRFLFMHNVNFRLKANALAITSPRSSAISTSLEHSVTILNVQILSHCPVPVVH